MQILIKQVKKGLKCTHCLWRVIQKITKSRRWNIYEAVWYAEVSRDAADFVTSASFRNLKHPSISRCFWQPGGFTLVLDGIKSSEYLWEHWQLPASEIFRDNQICHHIQSLLQNQPDFPRCLTLLENGCRKDSFLKSLVSDLYASLTDDIGSCTLPYISK